MVNRHRGETEAVLDGKNYRLCLTLGALAELEHAYGDEDMLAIAERFESGRLKASDAMRVIGAGLRGAGYDISDEAVSAMNVDGGAAGYVRIVADLLNATFPAPDPRNAPAGPAPAHGSGARPDGRPANPSGPAPAGSPGNG